MWPHSSITTVSCGENSKKEWKFPKPPYFLTQHCRDML